jgi:hypothetical protein
MFERGQCIAGLELLERLGYHGAYIQTWKAAHPCDPDVSSSRAMVVVRIVDAQTRDTDDYGREVHNLWAQIESLRPGLERNTGLAGRGLIPLALAWDPEARLLILTRPFFPERFADRFPPCPTEPAPDEMITALGDTASGLDHVAADPGASLLLSRQNLVWHEGSAAIVDFGIEPLRGLIERSYDGPRFYSWRDRDELYPVGHDSCSGPVFALASVYFALRTGRSVFAPPGPHRGFAEHARWCRRRWQEYVDSGRLALDEIADGRERAILARAFDRNLARSHGSARELAAELRGL